MGVWAASLHRLCTERFLPLFPHLSHIAFRPAKVLFAFLVGRVFNYLMHAHDGGSAYRSPVRRFWIYISLAFQKVFCCNYIGGLRSQAFPHLSIFIARYHDRPAPPRESRAR